MASKSMRLRPGIGDREREREREREGMDNDPSMRSRSVAEGDGPTHMQNIPVTHLGVAPQPVKQMAKEARAASGGISEREREMMERLRVLEESLGSLGEKTLNTSGLEVGSRLPCACLYSHVFHMRFSSLFACISHAFLQMHNVCVCACVFIHALASVSLSCARSFACTNPKPLNLVAGCVPVDPKP